MAELVNVYVITDASYSIY